MVRLSGISLILLKYSIQNVRRTTAVVVAGKRVETVAADKDAGNQDVLRRVAKRKYSGVEEGKNDNKNLPSFTSKISRKLEAFHVSSLSFIDAVFVSSISVRQRREEVDTPVHTVALGIFAKLSYLRNRMVWAELGRAPAHDFREKRERFAWGSWFWLSNSPGVPRIRVSRSFLLRYLQQR